MGVPRVALGAACAVVAGAAFGLSKWGSPFKEVEEEEDDCDEELPMVTRDEVVAIFGRLCEIMNATVTQVMRKVNAQAQAIPQAMLVQYLVEHFEAQLKEAEPRVFGDYGYAEEDVEEAVAYYEHLNDPQVVEAVNALRQLYMNVGGTIDLAVPEHLTVEVFLVVFEEYMTAVQQAQLAYSQHLHQIKAKGLQTTAQHLNDARQAKIAAHVAVVLTKHGLSNLIFQVAIEKYNEHPLFQAKIAQFKQNEAAPARRA